MFDTLINGRHGQALRRLTIVDLRLLVYEFAYDLEDLEIGGAGINHAVLLDE
jgi:hypothetical protein